MCLWVVLYHCVLQTEQSPVKAKVIAVWGGKKEDTRVKIKGYMDIPSSHVLGTTVTNFINRNVSWDCSQSLRTQNKTKYNSKLIRGLLWRIEQRPNKPPKTIQTKRESQGMLERSIPWLYNKLLFKSY